MAGATLYILSLLYSSQQPGQDSRQTVAVAIHEAMRRMSDPSESEVNLEELAGKLNVSYTWFRRMFRQHTGLSRNQYRLQLRIGRARTLLSDTDLTVKEVASRVVSRASITFAACSTQDRHDAGPVAPKSGLL